MTTDMSLDFDTLTLNEVCAVEDATGLPIDALAATDVPKGKVMRAMVWIVLRRENPEITLEEAGERMLSDINMGDDDEGEAEGN